MLGLSKIFASIATHLEMLTQKVVSFFWWDKCEEIFQNLKILLTIALILSLQVEGANFIKFCDTSLSRLDVVLMQDRGMI